MSGYFDAMDYVLDLAKVLGSYQSMAEEEGKPRGDGQKKAISRSNKLGKKDTRTLSKQQQAFAELEPYIQKNLGEHMLQKFNNYTENGFFVLKTMNSFPDFTNSSNQVISANTIQDSVWNTLLAPQIALVLAECVKEGALLRANQKAPPSTFEVLTQLITDWQPDLYKDGKHGKVIIKSYLNQTGKAHTPQFTAAINKHGIKSTGYRTIKEHLEILEDDLRPSDSQEEAEDTLARVRSSYYASAIMYRLETMPQGAKRLENIKYYLNDAMYLQDKGLAGIQILDNIPEAISEKDYLIRNLDLFRELTYRSSNQTALDILVAKVGSDPLGTTTQLLAQDRLIEFYSDIGVDIRQWMAVIWPKEGSAIWPKSDGPVPGGNEMKELSDYWALYYRMYACSDIGNFKKAYKLCEELVEFGKTFHAGEYHAAALIHMVVLSTKLEDLNDSEFDLRLNKNKIDGLLSELAYLLQDDGEITFVLNKGISDVIHGSADELLYSLAFRKYNQAHSEKVSPFRRLEHLCQVALHVVQDNSEADIDQRVKLYRKTLRESEPRITASTPLLKYSTRLEPNDFIEGVFDLSKFYGIAPEVFFLFKKCDEAQELFRALYEGIPKVYPQ